MGRVMGMLATLALCAGAAACAAGRAAPGSGDGGWDLAGVIAAVEPGSAATRVTVDLAPGTAEASQAVLLVSSATTVEVRRADGTSAQGSAADLRAGARIQAWHDGAEMRSLPPQYRATRIRVLPAS